MEVNPNIALLILTLCGVLWAFTAVALSRTVKFDDPRDHKNETNCKKIEIKQTEPDETPRDD